MDSSALYNQLFPSGQIPEREIAAVLDAARWPGLLDYLSASDAEWLPAGRNIQNNDAYAVLPYVVKLSGHKDVTQRILDEFGRGKGIFAQLKGNPDIVSLAVFVDDICKVNLPFGKKAWMRLYDPVIFTEFWHIASAEQKSLIAGQYVDSFFCENFEEGELSIFRTEENTKTNAAERLSISESQMDILDELYAERFVKSIAVQIAEKNIPYDSEEVLILHIKKSIDDAESFGISEHEHIVDYVICNAKHRWSLLSQSDAMSLISDSKLSPKSRLINLLKYSESILK